MAPQSDPRRDPAADLPPLHRGRLTEIIGGGLSVVWVVAVLSYILSSPPGDEEKTLGLVMTLLIVFLPLVLIWAAVITLRSVRELRAEAARLQAAVDAMRASYIQTTAQVQAAALKPSVERKLEEIAASAKQAETVLATFSSRRDSSLSVPSADRKAALAPPRAEPEAEQPALALGTPADALRSPLSVTDFIRALQFPETPEDKEGFRALRLALEDREVARLIRAAQDVLTLLSQEGIYMDDLRPEMTHPELWRRFATGERGRGVSAVGGIRDRSSLALTASRMREDTIFRDAAHHFLRTFDRVFQAFERNASDADLIELADTRTARAFMLFGRVAGVFD
ncbi:hypothetical protein [Neotabrizicola sp. VNH66]|uniref:hypothetical protein n=1 Tax=Neotabrizicola sp. VNH66 TaxID=3400918 RepID=UPI003C114349